MASLGKQIITNLLSDTDKPKNAPHVKGVYTANRNYKIACRFYYHFEIKGLRYDVAVERLHHEFDLSETRLEQLILQQRDTLVELKTKKMNTKALQKEIPYYNWY